MQLVDESDAPRTPKLSFVSSVSGDDEDLGLPHALGVLIARSAAPLHAPFRPGALLPANSAAIVPERAPAVEMGRALNK